MKLANWNTDRILGLSAMLISLLTLIIFIYQTNIMSRQSRLSVTPRLSFNQSEIGKDSIWGFSLQIQNKGLGPAIIESIEIIDHKNQRHGANFATYLNETYPIFEEYNVVQSNTELSTGSTFVEGETITLFYLEFHEDIAERVISDLNYYENELPFDVEVIYSSIYEEQWEIYLHKGSEHPRRM